MTACLTCEPSARFAPTEYGGEGEPWPDEFKRLFGSGKPGRPEKSRPPRKPRLPTYVAGFVAFVLLMVVAATLVTSQLPLSEMAFL